MEALRTWLWRAVVFIAVVLLVTGVWLAFLYRPAPAGSGNDEQLARVLHRAASAVFPSVALLLGIVEVVSRRRTWPYAAGAVVLAAALSFTGFLLPWDQLALAAVTVGSNVRGMFTATFGNEVKFVIIGSNEISRATLRWWFVAHAALLPIALVVCLALLRRRSSTVVSSGV